MQPKTDRYVISFAQPNSGAIMPSCVEGLANATARHHTELCLSQFGDVAHNFNMMWCAALNGRAEQGYTHFAMLHSDIRIAPRWLDTLLDEMDRVDADVMSTVIAIKDARGLTTTGIRYPGVWGTRRFTMAEIMQFPETFSIADVGDPETELLAINTGAWVCRLPAAGWPDQFPGFTDKYMVKWHEGQAVAYFDSEDWLFSEWCASQGLRVFATRKPEAYHIGAFEYGNNSRWGSWETDLQAPPKPTFAARASA